MSIDPRYDPTCGDLPDVEVLQLRASWVERPHDDLTEVIWQGFRESPFFDITRRDAESIAMTVLGAGYVRADSADPSYADCTCGHPVADHPCVAACGCSR